MLGRKRFDVPLDAYIGALFADTIDGKLTLRQHPITDSNGFVVTYKMDWTYEDACAMAQQFEALLSRLEDISAVHHKLSDREHNADLLSGEALAVWETYIAPFPPFEAGEKELLTLRAQETFTPEERALLDRYDDWFSQQCLQRLPYNRCHPKYLIHRAQRYERLMCLKPPKILQDHEARCLAEQMVLYYWSTGRIHTCRCCGKAYDLASYDGMAAYSICPVCHWEEDNSAEDKYSSANGATLRDYRNAHLSKDQ